MTYLNALIHQLLKLHCGALEEVWNFLQQLFLRKRKLTTW